jgi:acyl carrier protein
MIGAGSRKGRVDSNGLKQEVKKSIVSCLRLRIAPDEIADDLTLFRTGLGLDSIDALELVLELERRYGVVVADENEGRRILQSVNTIVAAIEEVRAGREASGP